MKSNTSFGHLTNGYTSGAIGGQEPLYEYDYVETSKATPVVIENSVIPFIIFP